jgi:hypothetical protein
VVLTGTEGFAGATVIEVRVAPALGFSTLRVAVPLTVPDWAVIVADPIARPLAIPVAIEATLASEDPHCTVLVRSLLLPSE